ncbi:MAG: FtsQ-type POTRA domain-containing protein [Alphaproteobacteria bacterium]|nr:FtsQ-type POTRA domain-containing protein [Alphaproteobacteria bacterium]
MQEVGSGPAWKRRASSARAPRLAATANAATKFASPPRQKKPRFVIARKLASGFAAFLAAFILTSIFTSDSGRMRLLANSIPEIDTAVSFAGFGLDQVSLKGQRYALVADIFDALRLDKSLTFASFDAASARSRIESLPWVASAELRRVYPNQLEITIRERKPFAVWQNGSMPPALVDADGRVLTSIALVDAPSGLARIKGAGAPEAAAEFWADLARFPALKALVRDATRVGGRRWTLTLANDTRIEFPAGAVSAALTELNDWPGFTGIKERGAAIVDLRTPGRIAVRPGDVLGPTSTGPKDISELLEPAG